MNPKRLKDGQLTNGLELQWYRLFEHINSSSISYSSNPTPTVPPLDNSRIVGMDGVSYLEDQEVTCLPKAAWDLLQSWYGPANFTVTRRVITAPAGELRIEMLPPRVSIFLINHKYDPHPPATRSEYVATLSAAMPYEELLQLCCKDHFGLDPSVCRLWKIPTQWQPQVPSFIDSNRRIVSSEVALKDLRCVPLDLGSELTLETVESASINRSMLLVDYRVDDLWAMGELKTNEEWSSKPVSDVLVKGLNNLGHTCFMNASLQSVIRLPELKDYFLRNSHLADLNLSNPLGTSGEVAIAYGDLFNELWRSSDRDYGSAGNFKRIISKHSSLFAGFQEQDSQEFLAFLLDSLHEDLNRIQVKPYTDRPEWIGGDHQALEEYAMVCWEQHKKRNDSLIVDLFQGQLKSCVQCPECKNESITFDPYMFLSLPIPVQGTITRDVYVVSTSPKRRKIKATVTVPSDASIWDIKCILRDKFGIDPSATIAGDVFGGRFYQFFDDATSLQPIPEGDTLAFYDVGSKVSVQNGVVIIAVSDKVVLPVFTSQRATSTDGTDYDALFGLPSFITMDMGSSPSLLDNMIKNFIISASDSPAFSISVIKKTTRELQAGSPDLSDSVKLSDLSDALSSGDIVICSSNSAAEETPVGWELFEDDSPQQPIISIYDCLQEFSKSDTLSFEDFWFCSQCNKLQPASKNMEIWSTPDILIVHLKRFSGGYSYKDKIEDFIAFPPQNLDLTQYVKSGYKTGERLLYDLYSVSQHRGGLSSGEYSAKSLNLDGTWRQFFDLQVSDVLTANEVVDDRAYVLFYRRQRSA